jgi:hypothetical protein
VLAGLKSLDLLVLPDSFHALPEEELAAIGALRTHPTLKNIESARYLSGTWSYNTTLSKDIFWQDWDREQGIVAPLRKSGIKFSLQKLPDGTWYLNLDNSAIRELTILSNAPISQLSISHTAVADLKPLRGMLLKQLWLFDTKVTDLSPLQGMPIDTLNLGGTKVSDLSPCAECRWLNFRSLLAVRSSTSRRSRVSPRSNFSLCRSRQRTSISFGH